MKRIVIGGLVSSLFLFAGIAQAAGSVGLSHTDTLTSAEVGTWVTDRHEPSSWTADGSNILSVGIDSSAASASTFERTEGKKKLLNNVDSVETSLYLNPSWENKAARAGIWATSNGAAPEWGIIDYTTAADYAPGTPLTKNVTFRTWDSATGTWTSVPGTYALGTWVKLRVELSNNTWTYYINDAQVGQIPLEVSDATGIKEVILNQYNFGAETSENLTSGFDNTSYTVKWKDLKTESSYPTLSETVSAAVEGDAVMLNDNITTSSEAAISKAITLDGNGHTLFAKIDNSAGSTSNNAGLGIVGVSGDVTIKDLTIDGSDSTKIHGINIFDAGNVTLDTVTVQNNTQAGITVNGANVTVNNVTTKNNTWGGINADLASDATNPATVLTVTGTMSQAETGPDIWQDDNTKNVTVNVNSQYSSQSYTHDVHNVSVTGTIWGIPPVITLNGDAHMRIANNSIFTDPGATATDSAGNTLTVSTDGSVDTVIAGDYTITYTATDALGFSATATRTVTVDPLPASSGGSRSGGGSSVSLPPQASPVAQVATGQVLGAFTDAETQAQIVVVKQQIASLISQLIGLLQAQLAAAIAAGQH